MTSNEPLRNLLKLIIPDPRPCNNGFNVSVIGVTMIYDKYVSTLDEATLATSAARKELYNKIRESNAQI